VRDHISHLDEDRILCDDQERAALMIRDGSLLRTVEQSLGGLD